MPVSLVGIICPPPVVEIGLTDMPKYGGGGHGTPAAPPETTGLVNKYVTFALDQGLNRAN